MFYATNINGIRTSDNDPAWCGTTNPAAGLALAENHLLGAYPPGWPSNQVRPDAKHVIVLISTGAPNSAQDDLSQPICPKSSMGVGYFLPSCRDQDVLTRHCFKATDTNCLNASYDVMGNGAYVMHSVYDPTNYDPYDRAFDMADIVAANGTQIFTIGLGSQIQSTSGDLNSLAPGETFLKYAAQKSGGQYYYAPATSSLTSIMQNIANQWTTTPIIISSTVTTIEINTSTPTPTDIATATDIFTATPTETATNIPTETMTPALTPTDTPTLPSTPTETATAMHTLTAPPTNTATKTPTITRTPTPGTGTFQSIGGQDGWVLELRENSNMGGSRNAISNTFRLGDDAGNRQYRGILSFNTSSLPDGAVIISATLKIRRNGPLIGGNPFDKLGILWTDLRTGPFDQLTLQNLDFQSPASLTKAGFFAKTPVNGWYSTTLYASALDDINKTGVTQFRLYFGVDDNNNHTADDMSFDSGDASNSANRPVLEIKYYYSTSTPTRTITPTPTIMKTTTRTPQPTQACFDC